MTDTNTLEAEHRAETGKSYNRRLRRNDQVPVVVYGGGKDPQNYSLVQNKVFHYFEDKNNLTNIVTLKCGDQEEKVVIREIHRHPSKTFLLHIDFQRVDENKAMKFLVPFNFVGGKDSPAVKVGGGLLSHKMLGVPVKCLAKDLPENISVDLSNMEKEMSVHLSDIKVPEGVEIISLKRGKSGDLAVVIAS
ncbi:MAG: 50S ribosomal protein L25/general stress protein Ctc [Methylococcales bacterium]|mgnify:CR=1 FL=1|jgi:large subunit ribosomal protein L25|nr:50S ribosomal protein L25/general stress protein Ctc [Methylococcales bacterium]MBT7408776.1 50S ribosomal protein L25/general stress protein Ctc [Methylococcales bacterium]